MAKMGGKTREQEVPSVHIIIFCLNPDQSKTENDYINSKPAFKLSGLQNEASAFKAMNAVTH